MPRPDDPTHVRHMFEAARKIQMFSEHRKKADLETEELFALGLVRLLEIIGEAATRVTAATQKSNPTIPWAQVIGMRNRLIHGYDVIDLDILWQTVVEDVPSLIHALECIVIQESPN
jgi:uncharacterized protein with HEPN domain